jgi:hypothetical protein
MQGQREEWKEDSGWINKNGSQESEDINNVKKPIHDILQNLLLVLSLLLI